MGTGSIFHDEQQLGAAIMMPYSDNPYQGMNQDFRWPTQQPMQPQGMQQQQGYPSPMGMGGQQSLPQPMQPQPHNNPPQLFPGMQSPTTQMYPPNPMQNDNFLQAKYARGGSVQPGMHQLAQMLEQQGQGDDSVLAHIHPLEAMQLQQQYGSSGINPITGLPQYGFKLGKIFKAVAPILGGLAGGALGGPWGATLGGGLAGAATGKKPLQGALMGAALGSLSGWGAGKMGMPGFGGYSSMKGPSDLLGGMFKGPGGMPMGTPGMPGGGGGGMQAPKGGGGIMDTIGGMFSGGGGGAGGAGGGVGGIGGLLDKALPLLAGAGMLFSKKKPPNEDVPEYLKGPGQQAWSADQQPRDIQAMNRQLKKLETGEPGGAEQQYFEDVNPVTKRAAKGGTMHGEYLDGATGGQADKIKALLSDGEYIIKAPVVAALGEGNNRAGASMLDNFVKNIGKHKKLHVDKKGLQPKTKNLESYLRSKKGR